jgi:NAD(P)-dependent dehydrogenase (short-subunit alcohol dehydrogenase family)
MTHTKRVAPVTGGANGIGCAIARRLLAAGWLVGIYCRGWCAL